MDKVDLKKFKKKHFKYLLNNFKAFTGWKKHTLGCVIGLRRIVRVWDSRGSAFLGGNFNKYTLSAA